MFSNFDFYNQCAVIKMNLSELETSVLTTNSASEVKLCPHSTLNPATSSMIGFKMSGTALFWIP